jgi:hypothetical protein
MLNRIASVSGGKNNVAVQWVAYRDCDCVKCETPLIESSGWKTDPNKILHWLGKIVCAGGGDGPEAVEKALEFANILLFADAPPHEERKGQIIDYHRKI